MLKAPDIMHHVTPMFLRSLLHSLLPSALGLVLAASALPACSGAAADDGSDESQSADELRAACGGIANLQCAAGKRCVLSSNMPDAMGHCYKECGGIAGLTCPASQSCVLDGNYPDAMGVCHPSPPPPPPTLTCATVDCMPGYHCEEKGINGGAVPVCLRDAVDAGPATDSGPTEDAATDAGPSSKCIGVDCFPGYHCEEKGLNGGSVGVCIAD